MSYRVEISPNNRAGCTATHCKDEGTKIKKGEIRQGVLVTIKEHQSMRYRHWGCVTPTVIHNWQESSGGDMDFVDGYDELPPEVQEKVKRALEQGHVDDEDWNGDKECNRYDPASKNQGMFIKKTPKKANKDEDDADGKDSPTKKRSRAKKDEDDEDEKPAPKKRAKKAAAVKDEDEDEEAPPPKKSRKLKKAAETSDADEAVPAPKKGRKSKKVANEDTEADGSAAAARKKKSAKSTGLPSSGELHPDAPPKAPPPSRKAKSAAKVVSDDEDEEDAPVPAKAPAKKSKRAAAVKSDTPVDEEEEAPKAKPARKGRAKKAAA